MFEKDEDIERLHGKIQSLVQQVPNTQLDSEKISVQQLKTVDNLFQTPAFSLKFNSVKFRIF